MKQIVVPVDGSEAANRAVRFAARLCRTESLLTLLYVYDAPAAAMLGLGALSEDEAERMKANVAKGSFESARAALSPHLEPSDEVVELGHPGREIVSFARIRSADIIVMGTRGQSVVQEILMGSVSDYVVRHAHCPVTVVR